jgi:hypothetical protein
LRLDCFLCLGIEAPNGGRPAMNEEVRRRLTELGQRIVDLGRYL